MGRLWHARRMEHWEVHYEPHQWWAQSGGIFTLADTMAELIQDCIDVAGFIEEEEQDGRCQNP